MITYRCKVSCDIPSRGSESPSKREWLITHARLKARGSHLLLPPFPPMTLRYISIAPRSYCTTSRKVRPFVDPLRLRIIAIQSITRSLSRFLVDSEQTDGRTVASPRGFAPIPRNQHKLGPRYETLRRPTRACGSPRYPRYHRHSWRESHVVRRGVVVAQGPDPSYKRRSTAATAVRLRPL